MIRATVLGAAVLGLTSQLAGQQPAPPPPPAPAAVPLAVGVEAPDFVLPAATMAGVSAQPVRLSDYRGNTVVLAFFFRARTRG